MNNPNIKDTKAARGKRLLLVLSFIFVALTIGIVNTAYLSYRNIEQQLHSQAEDQLTAIANLKIDELRTWRNERLRAEAEILHQNSDFARYAEQYLQNPYDAVVQAQIQTWLKSYRVHPEYDSVTLLDITGKTLLSDSGVITPTASAVLKRLPEIEPSAEVSFVDFYRNDIDQKVLLTILVPIIKPQSSHVAMAFVGLQLDPEIYLYPYLNRWPLPSKSAETILVRRDGNQVLVLTKLRFTPDAALNQHYPLTTTDLPTIKAVLNQNKIIESVDYHGDLALTYINAIPDSPWFLIAKIRTDEVYAPLYDRLWQTGLFLGVLILAVAAGLALIWWQQVFQYYREAEETLRKSEELYHNLVDMLDVSLCRWRPDTTLVFSNDKYRKVFGINGDGIGLKWLQFLPEATREATRAFYQELLDNPRTISYEHAVTARDGIMRHYQWIDTPILKPDGQVFEVQSIGIDITERIQAEALVSAQRDLARIMSTTTSSHIAWARCLDVVLQVTGMDGGGIYLFDPEYQALELVYHHGLSSHFVREASRYTADTPNVQVVLAGQSTYFTIDNISMIENLRAEGFTAVAVIPIQYQGRILGNLNVASYTLAQVPAFARTALETIATEIGNIIVYLRTLSSLHDSEAKYRGLIDSQEVAMSTIDAEGKFHYANQIGADLLATTPEPLVGKYLHDFLPADFADTQLSAIRYVIATGQGMVDEIERPVAGEMRWFRVSIQPVRDASGQPILALTTALDITKRKQVEEALRRSTQMLEESQEMALMGSWSADIRAGTFLATPAGGRLIGWLPGVHPAGELMEVIHPEDREYMAAAWDAAMRGAPYDIEHRIIKDGEVRWLHVKAKVTFDQDGSPISALGITQDITERKRAAEAQRESEDKYHLLFQTMVQGVVFQDAHGHFIDANPSAERILGLTLDQLLGRSSIDPSWHAIREDGSEFPGEEHPAMEALLTGHAIRDVAMGVYSPVTDAYRWININAVPRFKPDEEHPYQVYTTFEDITERKQAEIALRLSEEKYRGLMESLDSVVATIDYSGMFLYMNDRAAEQLGGVPDDFIGKALPDLFPESAASQQLVHIRRVICEDQSLVSELQSMVQGQPRWYRTSIQPIHDETGRVIYALINSTDINDLKLAQQELLELNATLEARVKQRTEEVEDLYDNAPIGYHSLDGNGLLIRINQTFLSWLGYTRPELIGRPLIELMTAQSQETVAQEFPRFKQRGWVRNLEVELIRKNGTILPVIISATVIYDQRGNYVMSRSTVFDNTERKKAEIALRESEEQNRLLFEETPDAVVLFDTKARIVRMNRAFQMLTGYTSDYLVGQTMEAAGLVLRDQVDRLMTSANQHLQTHLGAANVEFRLQQANGEIRDVGARVFQFNLRGHQHFLTAMRDITTEKQAAEMLRRANIELARAARAKDEFLANMSHELRTPLNAILGFTEVLMEQIRGPINERQRDSLRHIETSGRHLLALISDILDLSKVEAGRLDLQYQKIIVADICQSSLLFVKELASKKAIKLAFRLYDQFSSFEADPKRLKQILVNLLSNAVKFTPSEGHVSLEVSTDVEEGVIRFAVQDSGIGIAPDDLTRLFQPFMQVDSSLGRQYEGTGLGLALVRRLTELHGGSVTVTSEIGRGSCFTVALPYSSLSVQDTQQEALPQPEPTSSVASLRSALIVEDSESTAEQLTRYLQEVNVQTTTHPQGKGALEQAILVQPSVIFLDLLMSDQPGWDVLAQLKAEPLTRDIPVIIVSVVDERAKGLAAGAAEYLLKPVTRETVLCAITFVTNTSVRAEDTSPLSSPAPTGARILLAEDNEVNLLAVSEYLLSKGYEMIIARNGREAIDQAGITSPDLILMDIQMPEIDGLEAIRHLRMMPDCMVTPIIALTALAMPGDRERCLAAGANDYMTKPVSLKGLTETIQRLLQQRRQAVL